MNTRTARWLAWSLVGLYVALVTIGLTLQVVTDRPEEPVPGGFPVLAISHVAFGIWSVIGAVIVSRHPRHPIGWILCVIPVMSGVDSFAFGYAAYALITHPGSLPGADIMVVWTAISSSAAFFVVLLILLLLLFPDGRFLSPRWRLVAWIGIGAAAVLAPLAALKPGPLEDLPSFITNPIGVSESVWAVLDPLGAIAYTLVGLCLLAAAISLILRLRRARGDERQQVKWFAYTAAFFPIAMLFFVAIDLGWTRSVLSIAYVGYALSFVTFAGLPIATAIAIFKYRLYDIDILINRTMVYGALTGALALVYFGTVVLLQGLFRALTGQESQIAVVASTLAIAALFNPLRRRIQDTIDRRFYRRKYDAEQVLAEFAEFARDEVDLDRLTAELLRVIEETVQPEFVSLWLREVPSGSTKQEREVTSGTPPHQQEYSADDRRLPNNLASQVAPALRIAQLVRQQQLELQERQRLEQELRVARIIQQTLLPRDVPELPGWKVAAHWRPARAVGGDFYDFLHFPDGRLGLVIGDVTDKGVPAALVMATTRSILRGAAERLESPGEVLERVNELLCPDIPTNMFVTCLYALLDPASGQLQYANAGHNLPYQRKPNGVEELRATGMPLGLMPGMSYEEREATLAPGESVLFSSDGLVEAHNPQQELFGFPRLRGLVASHPGGAALIDYLLEELTACTGAEWEQEDDVTLMTLERLGRVRSVSRPRKES